MDGPGWFRLSYVPHEQLSVRGAQPRPRKSHASSVASARDRVSRLINAEMSGGGGGDDNRPSFLREKRDRQTDRDRDTEEGEGGEGEDTRLTQALRVARENALAFYSANRNAGPPLFTRVSLACTGTHHPKEIYCMQ